MKPLGLAVLLVLGLLAAACSSSQEDAGPLTEWSFEGASHTVESGIAGYVPDIGVDAGWAGGGILVYLSDQDLTCDQFPRTTANQFPPLPRKPVR
jgi:hypothetical protein